MWNLCGAWWDVQVWVSLFQADHQYLRLPWTLAGGSSDGRVWPHFSSKGFPACFCLYFCFSHMNFVFVINLFSSRREKNHSGIFIQITLNLSIHCGELSSLSGFPLLKHGISFRPSPLGCP